MPFITFILGFILFDIAAFSCDTFKFDLDLFFGDRTSGFGSGGYRDDNYYDYDFWSRRLQDYDASFGYWGYELDGSCRAHDDDDIDIPLQAGRAVGITACILGFLGIVVLLLASFIKMPRGILVAVGCIYGIFMCLFTLAMPVALFTDFCILNGFGLVCRPNAKLYLLGPAFILFIVGSSAMCCCMRPRSIQNT